MKVSECCGSLCLRLERGLDPKLVHLVNEHNDVVREHLAHGPRSSWLRPSCCAASPNFRLILLNVVQRSSVCVMFLVAVQEYVPPLQPVSDVRKAMKGSAPTLLTVSMWGPGRLVRQSPAAFHNKVPLHSSG